MMLIEVVVCLVILGLLLLIAVPRSSVRNAALDAQSATSVVTELLRRARGEAIAKNRPVAFIADTAIARCRIAGEPWRALPGSPQLAVVGLAKPTVASAAAAIEFFGDGSSSGGEVQISYPSRGTRIAVDWLTGQVRVGDGP